MSVYTSISSTMACSRQKMVRVRNLWKGFKAVHDLKKLNLSIFENRLKLSHSHEEVQHGSLGGFVLDSDLQHTEDVTLRRKCDSGEEITISAFPGPPKTLQIIVIPRDIFMKVCVKKQALSSIMQFECKVYGKGEDSDFDIKKAYFLGSPTCLSSSIYKGPLFSKLDVKLQDALKEYVIAKGIGVSMTNFLIHSLYKREYEQYVNWLKSI